jgi:hypothetical protein
MEDKCEADSGRKRLSFYPQACCPEISGAKARYGSFNIRDSTESPSKRVPAARPRKRGSAPLFRPLALHSLGEGGAIGYWLSAIGHSRSAFRVARSAQNRTAFVKPNTTLPIPISHQKIDRKALSASFSVSAAGTLTIWAPTISPDCQPNPFALP